LLRASRNKDNKDKKKKALQAATGTRKDSTHGAAMRARKGREAALCGALDAGKIRLKGWE
jgi:hypothetical protein